MGPEEDSIPAPIGVIIAGGRAQRLGGGDKTLRLLGGRPILSWLIERLAPQCAGLALNANGDADRFPIFGLPVVADHAEDADAGPLAGVLAGLDWVAHHHPAATRVLTMPGDSPFPPPDLAARLHAARETHAVAVAAARSGGRLHALAALWPVDLRNDLRGILRLEGERRVVRVLDRAGYAPVEWPTVPFDAFANVNTPDDLAAAALACPAARR